MIKIIFIILLIFFIIIIWYYYQINLLKMENLKIQFLIEINNLSEEALERRVKFSGVVFKLRDVKKNPNLIDHLSWDDFFFYQIRSCYYKQKK